MNSSYQILPSIMCIDWLNAKTDLDKIAKALDDNWKEVYDLADQVCERHIQNTPGSAFLEPCVNRLKGADFDFDKEWKDKI